MLKKLIVSALATLTPARAYYAPPPAAQHVPVPRGAHHAAPRLQEAPAAHGPL